MDTKTIEAHSLHLSKSFSSSDALKSDKVLSMLAELRTGVKASEELLRSTRIGITVNKLKQHKNPEIAKQASELVSKWKQDVTKHRNNTKSPQPVQGVNSPAKSNGAASSATATEITNGTTKEAKKNTIRPEQRNSKTDGVKTTVTGNSIRDNCLRLMYDGIAFMSEQEPASILPVATAIEAAAYAKLAPETSEPYKNKMRSLYQNLKIKTNSQLRTRLALGTITPERFVNMTLEELKSPERRAEDAALHEENVREAMVAEPPRSISVSLKCGKCGERQVSYSQAQTRSADEPMTTFCECAVCRHRWKFC